MFANGPRLQGPIFQWNSLIYKINMDQGCFLFLKTLLLKSMANPKFLLTFTRYNMFKTCARGVSEKCDVYRYISWTIYSFFSFIFPEYFWVYFYIKNIDLFFAWKDSILMWWISVVVVVQFWYHSRFCYGWLCILSLQVPLNPTLTIPCQRDRIFTVAFTCTKWCYQSKLFCFPN